MMPRANVVELEMSVDDALKYIISMGVVVPGGPNALPTKANATNATSATDTTKAV